MLLDIGGVIFNLDNLVSFKVDKKRGLYYLQIFMTDGKIYNIEYSNVEHLLSDIKKIMDNSEKK